MEIVEGRAHPPQRGLPEYEAEFGKSVSLILRMSKTIFHSGRVVVMDSAFCQLNALIELLRRGVFALVVIKKKRFWPRSVRGQEMDEKVGATPIGTVAVLQGAMGANRFMLIALRDSKHVLKLMSTYGSIDRVEPPKRRMDQVTHNIVSFKYPEVISHYYIMLLTTTTTTAKAAWVLRKASPRIAGHYDSFSH